MSRSRLLFGAGLSLLLACGSSQPPPTQVTVASASAKPVAPPKPPELGEEPEPALTELRTGRVTPIEHAEVLSLTARRHALDGDEQLLELVLPNFAAEVPGDSFWLDTEARISGSRAPYQLVSRGKNAGEMVLWLRRPKADLAAELLGDAYTPAVGARPGHHFRFRVPTPSGAPSPELVSEWATEMSKEVIRFGLALGLDAAERLQARYKLTAVPRRRAYGSSWSPNELASLMDTFSGRASVQAALASQRHEVLSAAKQPRSVPIAKIKGPELARHPWAAMSKRLGKAAPPEPLANAVPADFYFVRARSFSAFSDLLGFVQSFGAPAADLFDGTRSERGTLPRYLAELGVETGELSRVLGPEVVQDLALTGSDPYVHEGTDVTLIFRLKSPLLFRAALQKALATHGAAHGGTQSSSFVYEGVTVDVARSPDGRVRQHHAVVGELELVSNSPAAIKRVIAAAQGKAPRLSDEPDFGYMLARDADVPADLLAYIGDRFVENVVGPAQKISEARRQVALSELLAPPYASLLYGWVHGKSPASEQELTKSGLLWPNELKHVDGARIAWAPGSAPRSSWGSPAALEPLIDLPAVAKVSPAERDSYAEFARIYQARWSDFIDPIALRVGSAPRAGGKALHGEMRVLPLVVRDEAARFDLGGDGRVAASELSAGARLSVGIGKDSPLRRELSGLLRLFSGRSGLGIGLDWLGDYALVGVADRGELLRVARAARRSGELPIERPASPDEQGRDQALRTELELLAGFPVYAVVGLRSRVAATVGLAAARHYLEGTGGGAIDWSPLARYRDVEVVRIRGREGEQEIALYYALAGDNLVVSFNRTVMRSLIDQALDGKLPKANQPPSPPSAKDGQVVLELNPTKKGSLKTVLAWGLALGALEGSWFTRGAAEALLRGAPEVAHDADRSAELSLAYFGSVPLTPDGERYSLSPQGLLDRRRGTAHAPEWPAVPTPGASAERLLATFGGLRSDLSFDVEPQLSSTDPPLRSLRVRLDLWLR